MLKEIEKDNRLYKKSIISYLKKKVFCPFKYEKQMDFLFSFLKKDFNRKNNLKVLEAGCGQGRLLYYLNEFNSHQIYFGIDYLKENAEYAKKIFKSDKNIIIKKESFYHLSKKYRKAFDISISYKTLSWLPDYKDAVRELIKATKNKIYITSLFYDGALSFDVKINDLASKTFNYLNVYSVGEFGDFCIKNGAKKVKFYDMKLDIDLPKPKNKNVLKTYTIRTKNNENIEINGLIILHWKLVIIEL